MHWHTTFILGLASLLNICDALTITSPSGGTADPTQPIIVTWTHTSSDPSSFNLVFSNTDSDSLTQPQTVGTSISTNAGTFTIPANTILAYGSDFILTAQGASGNSLATSPSFALAQGSYIQTTNSQGQTTLISSSLANSPAGTTGAPMTAATTGPQASATASASATESTPPSTGSSGASSFQTSTKTTGMSASASSSTSSSATASTSANAQPKLGSSREVVLSAAGVLAGVVALLA